MKTTILALILLVTATVSNGQLSMLPGDNSISLAAGDQTAPAIARGGNTFLAVWMDNRPNPYGSFTWSEYETSRDIYATRLDLAGNILDPVPLAIVAEKAIQANPQLAWNGTNWLVVYESCDLNGTGYYYQKSLEAVRVSPSGQVLDAEPIKLYGLIPSGPGYWGVASDGNNWVVVDQTTSTSGDIVAVRISPTGVLLDPPTRAVVRATYYMRSNLKVAYAAGVFLLTFDEYYDTSAVRFDSDLNLLDTGLIHFLDTVVADLTSNGTQFYAVWNQQLPTYEMAVFGSRVDTNGQKLDGAGINISGANSPQVYTSAGVAWDGLNWKVTWFSATMRVARVDSAGAVLDPGGVPVVGPQTGPSAGTGNGGVQLIWSDDRDVFSANISAANTAGPNRPVSIGAPQQLRSDIATNGNGYMLVYRSVTSAGSRLLAQPLDGMGNPLTTEPVQLDTGGGDPNVAWNGSVYLVAWGTASGVVAQRLLPSGVKLDPTPFMVMTPAFGAADVAALGETFLVAGRRFGYNQEIINAIGARVRGSDGMVLDATPLLLGGNYVSRPPAVTPLGNRFLVAFINNATHDNPAASTSGVFVETTSPNVVNAGTYFGFNTSSANGIFELGLASSGNQALLTQSLKITGSETDLVARVIQIDGTAGPQLNLTPWAGNQYRPRAAWDGTNFIVIYQDQKNRIALWTLDQLDARSDLFGMRLSSTGTVIDPQGFVFSAFDSAETDPNVTALNGISLLSASLMMNDTAFANYRIAYDQLGAAGNQWPVAVINASATTGDVPLAVDFTSTGSIDPDGSIISYRWDFGDGTISTVANPSYTFTIPAAHTVILTVTDNQGTQTRQALKVNATAPNQLPVAIARADRSSGNPPLDVILYADGSYDPDGFIGNIEWLFSDGGSYWGSPAYHTFETNGIHTVTLHCYDGRGGIGTTNLTIYIGITPTPTATPTATATPIATPTPTPTPSPSPTPPPLVSISGIISYCSASSPDPVPNVMLTLTGTMSASTLSDASGNYTLSSLPSGGSYVITPSKTALPPASAGIDTVDVIALQRHFLALGAPLTGCRLTAADVDLNSSINTVDVIAVQRFFLGQSIGIANTGNYQFSPASRTYTGLVRSQTAENYDTLVFGDVAAGFVERVDGPSQTAPDDGMRAGEVSAPVAAVALPEVAVDQSTSNFIAAVTTSAIDAKDKLVGFQGDFTFDERVVTFQGKPVEKGGLTGGNWNVSGNVLPGAGPIRTLRISAYSNDFTPLSGEGTLFELRMTRVNKAAQGTPLLWAAPPDQFVFIDADLNTQKPGNAAPGSVTPYSYYMRLAR